LVQIQPLQRLPVGGTKHEPHLRRGLLLLVLAAWCALAVACVPFLASKKETPTTGVAPDRPARQLEETTPEVRGAGKATERSESPQGQPHPEEDEFDVSRGNAPRTEKLRDRAGAIGKPADMKRAEDEAGKGQSGRDRRVPEWANKLFRSGSADQETPAVGDSEKPENREVHFEKYDRAKHLKKIKNSALDILNKDSACNLARICNDSITNDWWLTLYRKTDRTYSFTTYVWDQVNEKWEQSYVSGKEPLSKLSHHLRSSSSGKYCEVVKGRLGSELEASDEMARKTAPRKRRPGR